MLYDHLPLIDKVVDVDSSHTLLLSLQLRERRCRIRVLWGSLCIVLLLGVLHVVTGCDGDTIVPPRFRYKARHRGQERWVEEHLLFDRQLRMKSSRKGSFELLEVVPHDQTAFTQGLQTLDRGAGLAPTVYEGTGLYGRSDVRIVELSTGKVLQRTPLPARFFGEGVTFYTTPEGSARLLQLTWKERTCFVYNSDTLELLGNFTFATTNKEGWGITYRQFTSTFVVSDGSSFLHIWDSTTFQQIKRVRILRESAGKLSSVNRINELEWDPKTDTILANRWHTNELYRINPDSGFVVAVYDMSTLYPLRDRPRNADVMNGVALVPGYPDQVWLTGKLWPHMFRVRLID